MATEAQRFTHVRLRLNECRSTPGKRGVQTTPTFRLGVAHTIGEALCARPAVNHRRWGWRRRHWLRRWRRRRRRWRCRRGRSAPVHLEVDARDERLWMTPSGPGRSTSLRPSPAVRIRLRPREALRLCPSKVVVVVARVSRFPDPPAHSHTTWTREP